MTFRKGVSEGYKYPLVFFLAMLVVTFASFNNVFQLNLNWSEAKIYFPEPQRVSEEDSSNHKILEEDARTSKTAEVEKEQLEQRARQNWTTE